MKPSLTGGALAVLLLIALVVAVIASSQDRSNAGVPRVAQAGERLVVDRQQLPRAERFRHIIEN
jgi:hypothetical protein